MVYSNKPFGSFGKAGFCYLRNSSAEGDEKRSPTKPVEIFKMPQSVANLKAARKEWRAGQIPEFVRCYKM
jgi:hypothetical protein